MAPSPVTVVTTAAAASDSSKTASGTSTPTTTSQPVGLTRSDSLAAVIADLNQTLAMTSVSNGELILLKLKLENNFVTDMPPQFPTASTLFTAAGGGGGSVESEATDAFDQL